jgi:hypothetical protein
MRATPGWSVNSVAGEVDLRLISCRRLEPHFEWPGMVLWPDRRDEALHRRIGAFITALANLAGQADGREIGIGGNAFMQVIDKGRDLVRPPHLARTIDGEIEPTFDVFADRLGIAARSTGDRGHRQALTV